MRYLDLTLPNLAENLALDEALLNAAERRPDDASEDSELLRFWESTSPAVVVGRGTQVDKEIAVAACGQDRVPIVRRCSGGTSVVVGPGCLMYAVVIRYDNHEGLRQVDNAHAFVMQRMRDALGSLDPRVQFLGTCDLVLEGKKFSGNALRCKKRHFLYHGTVLYDFPLHLISRYLKSPPRQPEYRGGREHALFVTNFRAKVAQIREALCEAWNAVETTTAWPAQETGELVRARYLTAAWNRRL